MSSKYGKKDKTSEDNCARLAAYLLHAYGLNINHLYTHTYWLNVRDGKKGSVDELNVKHHPYKMCPAYILPHWQAFKKKVAKYLHELEGNKKVKVNSKIGLNVRTGAGLKYKKVKTLVNGTICTIYSEKNGWGKISKTADQWICLKYTKKI